MWGLGRMRFEKGDLFMIGIILWIILGLLMIFYVAWIEYNGFPGYGP